MLKSRGEGKLEIAFCKLLTTYIHCDIKWIIRQRTHWHQVPSFNLKCMTLCAVQMKGPCSKPMVLFYHNLMAVRLCFCEEWCTRQRERRNSCRTHLLSQHHPQTAMKICLNHISYNLYFFDIVINMSQYSMKYNKEWIHGQWEKLKYSHLLFIIECTEYLYTLHWYGFWNNVLFMWYILKLNYKLHNYALIFSN